MSIDWDEAFSITINVNNVAVGLGLNLEKSIHYLDLDPPALLHVGYLVLTYWSGSRDLEKVKKINPVNMSA